MRSRKMGLHLRSEALRELVRQIECVDDDLNEQRLRGDDAFDLARRMAQLLTGILDDAGQYITPALAAEARRLLERVRQILEEEELG